jgi:serine/threonine protein kinase
MALRTLKRSVETIGRYQILAKIGEGSMCSVYQACDPATEEVVAIKLAAPHILDHPVLVKRFEQEYTVARGLCHPHLVRVLDFDRAEAGPYLVMEFVDGPSLGDRIEDEGRLPEAEAVRIMAEVATGLNIAHQRRIIHRDIKPDNILLTSAGEAKLADLGLAKDIDADEELTRTRSGLGTPNFMAPEQFHDAKNADVRCDVYSLGATLYMAVTGKLPFQARGPMGILKKKLGQDLPPARDIVPELSWEIGRVISRAVRVKPEERPATCLEFIRELQGYLPDTTLTHPGTGSASPRSEKAGMPPRREQRATVRYSSTQKGSCYPVAGGRRSCWSAKVVDISASGIALQIDRRFELQTVLIVELPGMEQSPSSFHLARVVRIQSRSPRRWIVGCTFTQRLTEDEVQAMR